MSRTQLSALLLLYSYTGIAMGDTLQPAAVCLLQDQLLHPQTLQCEPPLRAGLCGEGEVFMLEKEGQGGCQHPPDCEDDQFLILDKSQALVCTCTRDNQHIFGGSCNFLFSTNNCPEGKVLMENGDSCPDGFLCKKEGDCRGYKRALNFIKNIETSNQQKVQHYLNSLKCQEGICCSKDSEENLLNPRIISLSQVKKQAVCTTNACTEGTWPWGGQSCVEADETVMKCTRGLVLGPQQLTCSDLSLQPPNQGLNSRNGCGKRRIWSRHFKRCFRIFGK